MKKPLVIVVIVGSLILLLILFLAMRKSTEQLTVSPAFAGNFRFAEVVPADDNVVRFFTGNQFASYDLDLHQSSSLTPLMQLPEVTNVKWGENGVLFKTTDHTFFDQLKPQLDREFLPSNRQYWWWVRYGSDKPVLVGDFEQTLEVGSVAWRDDETFLYIEPLTTHDAEGDYLLKQTSMGGANVEIGKIPAVYELLRSDENYAYGLSTDGLVKIDLVSGNSQLVIDHYIIGPQINLDGTAIAYIEREVHDEVELDHQHLDDPGTLVYYDLETNREHHLIEHFNGSIFPGRDGGFVAVEIDQKDNSFVFTRFNQDLGEGYVFDTPEDTVMTRFHDIGDGNNFLARDSNNFAYLLALEDAAQLQNLPVLQLPRELIDNKNIYENTYYMSYFPDRKNFAVYAISDDFELVRQKSIEYFESQGVDHRQLPIRWYPKQ